MWSTSRPALQQCGQREKEKRCSHGEIEELIAFPFGRTWHFLARCRGAVSCLSCCMEWCCGAGRSRTLTRCFVQETMILDSQHASTIVTAATEPEQFILGTAEKSIGSASRYELCECVDPKISPRKEFCVMKILPIFFVIFLWDFVGSRKVCWQSASRWHQRCAPCHGSFLELFGDVHLGTQPQRFFLRLSSPDIRSNNCCFVAFRAGNRAVQRTMQNTILLCLVDVQRPPDCPQLG